MLRITAPVSRQLVRHLASKAAPVAAATNTVSAAEIAHFSSLSAHWWDPTGEFALLHRMNPARVKFMRETIEKDEELVGSRWLKGKSVLDVGCGGGIFAEAIARLGAKTTAVDAAGANIGVAKMHASYDPCFELNPTSTSSPALNHLEYLHCAAENLVEEGRQFDVVCAMEVLEHVDDPAGFLRCVSDLTKPGGLLLISTINRTPLSQLLSITMAEDVLRLVTPKTHTYSKFVRPEELAEFFEEAGWGAIEKRGCIYDPIYGGWRLLGAGDFGGLGEQCNYFMGIKKPL